MKITITTQKEVTEEIEIETPQFFKHEFIDFYYKVEEDRIISVNTCQLFVQERGEIFFDATLKDTLKKPKSDEKSFYAALEKSVSIFKKIISDHNKEMIVKNPKTYPQ